MRRRGKQSEEADVASSPPCQSAQHTSKGYQVLVSEVEPHTHAGYLLKQGGKLFVKWQARYFVLKGSHLLYFPDNKKTTRSKGSIPLKDALIVPTHPKKRDAFSIVCPNGGKHYHLGALHPSDVDPWLRVLRGACEGGQSAADSPADALSSFPGSKYSDSTSGSGSSSGSLSGYSGPSGSSRDSYVASSPSKPTGPPAIMSGGLGSVAVDGGRRGMFNIGNTCFMNAAVQCLSSTQPLTEYFLAQQHVAEVNRDNPLGMKGAVAESYARLVSELWEGEDGPRAVEPRKFKRALAKFAPQFSGYHQHDMHELLAFLLDGLHEDLNRVHDKPYVEDREANGRPDEEVAAEAWMGYLRRNKSVIVDLFQGQLKSTLTCEACGFASVKFDPFMYLSLPVQGEDKKVEAPTLETCLDLFTQPERLSDDECWRCPKCKDFKPATKKFDIWKLPPILVIHLKRFKYSKNGHRSKIRDKVDCPLTAFDLSSFVTSPQREAPLYDLYAVGNHFGVLGGGHYTAHCLNCEDRRWYDFDDDEVAEIDESEVGGAEAYVLFYGKHVDFVRRQTISSPDEWPHVVSPGVLARLQAEEKEEKEGKKDKGKRKDKAPPSPTPEKKKKMGIFGRIRRRSDAA